MGQSSGKRGNLTQEFVAELKANKLLHPDLKHLIPFLKGSNLAHKKFPSSPHICSAMLNGELVDWSCIEGLILFLKEKRRIEFNIHEKALSDVHPAWRLGWIALWDVIEHGFRLETEAYCESNDIKLAAKIGLASAGRKFIKGNEEYSEKRSIAAGLEAFYGCGHKRDMEYHVSWLSAMHKKNNRTIMFAVADGQRVAMSCVLPLTYEGCLRVRDGRINHFEITPNDIVTGSSDNLWVGILAEVPPTEFVDRVKLGYAQLNTILYQVAALCPKQTPDEPGPTLVAASVHDEGHARCLSYGFHDTGVRTPVGHTVMELSWDRVQHSDVGKGMYWAMCGVMLSSQRAQKYQTEKS